MLRGSADASHAVRQHGVCLGVLVLCSLVVPSCCAWPCRAGCVRACSLRALGDAYGNGTPRGLASSQRDLHSSPQRLSDAPQKKGGDERGVCTEHLHPQILCHCVTVSLYDCVTVH